MDEGVFLEGVFGGGFGFWVAFLGCFGGGFFGRIEGGGLGAFLRGAFDEGVDGGDWSGGGGRGFFDGRGFGFFGCGSGGSGRGRGEGGEFFGIDFSDGADDVAEADFFEVLDGFEGGDFEVEAFVRGPFHAGIGFGEGVDDGEEAVRFVGFGGLGEVGPEGFGEAFAAGIWVEFGDDEGADGADGFGEELGEVFSGFGLLVDDAEGVGGFFGEDALEEAGDGFAGGEAEDVEDVSFGDFLSAEGDELVEHGLGVAHASIGPFGDGPSG